MSLPSKGPTKMERWLEYRVRVACAGGKRILVGTLMAFDKYLNLVLADCEEFRRVKVKGSDQEREVKRVLGFVLLRGETIAHLSAEAPPASMAAKTIAPGPGKAQAAGRGAPIAGMPGGGAGGPSMGAGAPSAAQMQPRGRAPGMPM